MEKCGEEKMTVYVGLGIILGFAAVGLALTAAQARRDDESRTKGHTPDD